MRGIQINNYFNNHITLNGKKLNQDPQPVLQTAKPKPIEFVHQSPSNVLQSRSPPSKSAQLPAKKRTNTLVQLKKQFPSKRSVSNDRQRNAISAKKKQQIASESSNKQEEQLINISNRKLKPSSSKGGLGKRSKSTIIRTNQQEIHRQLVKKEPKKVNSNPTVESAKPKTKRKKLSKIIQSFKQTKSTVKPSSMKKMFIPIFSKEIPKKEKLKLKFDKTQTKAQKKSARNNVSEKFSVPNKNKASKPASARQKKSKKCRFIEQLKQKYENQTILEGDFTNRQKESQEKMDTQFLSVMNSLQKVLNSVGSKHKLRKQLELINQKLKEFKLQSQNAQSGEEERNLHSQRLHQDCTPVLNPLHQVEIQPNLESQEEQLSQENKHQEYSDQQEEYKLKQVIDHEPAIAEQEQRNPLTGKRKNDFFFDEIPQQDSRVDSDRRKEIQILKQFKKESTKMMEKVGLNIGLQIIELERQAPITTLQREVIKKQNELSIVSVSSMTSSGNFQDKYPLATSKSPKFDQNHLLSMISLKEQFASNKHDKMSELVKKMFEKQLVSPKSYEFQLKNLDIKYQEENKVVQSLKKQAEQMSSMLSEIKKDKEQIKNIDDLIRNQQWEQAQKLVQINKNKELQQKNISVEYKQEEKHQNQQPIITQEKKQQNTIKDRFSIGWGKEQAWQRVKVKNSDIQDNEFVDIGVTLNRNRVKAQPKIDIDEECGGTQQSIQLQEPQNKVQSEQEYIYYNQQNDNEQKIEEGGLIRLVEITLDHKTPNLHERGQIQKESLFSNEVIHISNEQARQKSLEASIIDKNPSNVSVTSSQSDRKGFTTNLYFIKEYCIALCEFVRDNQIFKTQFKNSVLKPLQFNLFELLQNLKSAEPQDLYFKKRQTKSAISQVVWNEFNSQYESLKCNANKGKTSERYVVQRQQELIFVRMIYDVLNESLDFQRPGGQHGKALPWRQNAKHLKNLKQLTQNQRDNLQGYDLMFGVAIARIIQWGSCLCGFLSDTVELQNTEIDQSYVNHIRETRMAFLLQKMMAEQQPMMSNFQMQETTIYFKMASSIAQELFTQVASEMSAIENNKSI